ncbi:MAG: CAP domain-containing protein [Pseudomonadota bacterium]
MQLINSQRQATRMSPLTLDPRLIRAAQLHAQDMANTGYFSHTGRNGSTVKTRVSGQGFKGCYWAENIGQGQADANAIVSAWMGSSKHRKNILSRKAKAVGVGLADRTWVAVFAAPC